LTGRNGGGGCGEAGRGEAVSSFFFRRFSGVENALPLLLSTAAMKRTFLNFDVDGRLLSDPEIRERKSTTLISTKNDDN
jgi:hypothetical protein